MECRHVLVSTVQARLRPALSWTCQRFYGTRQESTQRKQRPNRRIRLPLILTERVPNLGGKGEVVHVKRGYGRNYLLPTGKAVYCSPENAELYSAQLPTKTRGARQRSMKELVRNVLTKSVLRISKDGKNWTILETEISAACTKLMVHVPLDMITFPEPITEYGESEVNIAIDNNEVLTVKVEIAPTASS